MDDNEPNIFEAGTSGPKSDVATSDSQSPATVDGIAGRVDPEIARTSASLSWPLKSPGGDNNASNGDASNTASGTADQRRGKPGRHPGNCNCERCIARRNAANGGEAQDAPKARSIEVNASEKTRNVRASFVEKTLQAIHLGIVGITKCPEFTLEKDDAQKLGEATAAVLAHYKVKMTAKQEAYALLIEAAAQVYPPMFVAVYLRKMKEQQQPGRVVNQPAKPFVVPPVGPDQPQAPTPQQTQGTAPPPAQPAPQAPAPPPPKGGNITNFDPAALRKFDPTKIQLDNPT